MNYYLQLCENAQQNFDRFQAKQMELSKEEIFANSYKIDFYSTMLDFILDEENYLQPVDCEYLCVPEGEILDELYDYFLGDIEAEITTYAGKIRLLSNFIIDNILDDEDIKKLHKQDQKRALERKISQNISLNYGKFMKVEAEKSAQELICDAEKIYFYQMFQSLSYIDNDLDLDTLKFLYSKGSDVLDYLFEAHSYALTESLISKERLVSIIEDARNQDILDLATENEDGNEL